MVAFLGYTSRSVVQEMLPGRAGGTLTAGGYEARMFTYHPAAQRITVFFVAYQLKNTYDTIVWDDGIIFIIHHVLTLVTTVRCCFLYGFIQSANSKRTIGKEFTSSNDMHATLQQHFPSTWQTRLEA